MGGSNSEKKGGGNDAYVSYDYYGTIAAILRCGPVDQLETLIVDGEIIWSGPINRTDPGISNPYTLTISNSTWLQSGGYVKLYWGDDDQTTPDAALTGHPPYRGFAYLVFHKFLFGRERTTPGNIEVVASAKPRPPASVIASSALDNGCANVWAILAEILTSIHGAGLASSRLDATSWSAAHTYFAATTERKLLAYAAPLLSSQAPLAAICADLLSLCDGGLRLKSDGTIEAFYYPVDPGDLNNYTTLTANDLTSPPRITFGSWDDVPTGVQISFIDQYNWFADWSVNLDDLRALQQAAEPRRDRLQLDFVTRQAQAMKLAAEYIKRKCQPQISGSISVRPRRALNPSGTMLRVGDRFLLDIEPEPGGDALLQLCRVLSRKQGPAGPVTINFTGEILQPAVPYTPDYTPPDVEELTVAALASARIVPMPLTLTDNVASVAALAARGDDLTIGAHVLFDVEGGTGTFRALGIQTGFAVPVTLVNDYSSTATGDIRLELQETRDQAIALRQPGASGAQNNELLLVLYHLDGDYFDEDASGRAILEWFSIQDSSAVSGDTYDFTVLRPRLGTIARSWTADDTGWIIPKISLLPFRHANFPTYVNDGTALVFRLNPFSRFAEYEDTPADLDFKFPTNYQRSPQVSWTTPSTQSYTLASDGNLTPAATVTDRDANLVRLTLYYVRDDTGIQTVVFDARFAAASSKTLSDCFTLMNVSTPINFPGQTSVDTYYTMTLRAADSQGNIVESRRYLMRAATGGGGSGFVPPSFTITRGSSTFSVQIDTASPATKLQYGRVDIGDPPPGSPTTVDDITVTITGYPWQRVYARSGNGSSWSSWTYIDLEWEWPE